ncbi:hypothetical protein GCM10010278_54060 [Streptomyces melanogenes]|nr:hypothetical protein GCM10010278_54060 [Streptomyces melanogenes]
MTGTATHFTHQGIPANISRAAIVLTSFVLVFLLESRAAASDTLDARGEGAPNGGLAALDLP